MRLKQIVSSLTKSLNRQTATASFLAIALSLTGTSAMAQDKADTDNSLTIYTYDSFVADWGPGPQIKKNFEEQCNCTLNWVAAADGVALLNRLKLEGSSSKADIVLGLDTNLTSDARASGLFAQHHISTVNTTVPGNYQDDIFLPYDYSYFAVIYDSEKLENPPASMEELINGDANEKIILLDPRTSTPGLGMLLWMKDLYGDQSSDQWEKLNKKILTVTPGWSEGYGLFTKGEAPMVLSYTTSPAYHLIYDKTDRYKALAFTEGNYLQIELAAKTVSGADNPLAEQFMQFITEPGFQDVIPETNWMLPAWPTSAPLNPAFDALVKPVKTLQIDPELVGKNRKDWVDEWLDAMSK